MSAGRSVSRLPLRRCGCLAVCRFAMFCLCGCSAFCWCVSVFVFVCVHVFCCLHVYAVSFPGALRTV